MNRRILQIFTVLVALAAPLSAHAESNGIVHAMLRGSVVDPYATTLRIVPPKGAMVMVYSDGKPVGWFSQPGYVQVQPNHVYGVIATKGKYVMFNQGVVARHGMTELSWAAGEREPSISFEPAFIQPPHHHLSAYQPSAYDPSAYDPSAYHPSAYHPSAYHPSTYHGPRGHHAPGYQAPHAQGYHHSARSLTTGGTPSQSAPAKSGLDLVTAERFTQVYLHMAKMPSDTIRLNVLRPWARSVRFTAEQSDALLATFQDDQQRATAAQLLD